MTGLITLTLAASLIVFGVLVGAGKLAPKYHISGTFSSAGQGLLPGSDVKVHGINIGQVTGVRLVKGKARVGMKIEKGEKVPADSSATIRPKTLFGEKFVDIDPGPNEARGPFLKNGDVIRKTVGGFELERVLNDPPVKCVLPALVEGVQGDGMSRQDAQQCGVGRPAGRGIGKRPADAVIDSLFINRRNPDGHRRPPMEKTFKRRFPPSRIKSS